MKLVKYVLVAVIPVSMCCCKTFTNPNSGKIKFAVYHSGKQNENYYSLKLYADQTYFYREKTTQRYLVKDHGVWELRNDTLTLNSIATLETYKADDSGKERHFFNTAFVVDGDSLSLCTISSKTALSFTKQDL